MSHPIPQEMKSPQDRRNVWRGGVLQIGVTRACDKACFGCTQGSNLGGKPYIVSVDQFEAACASLCSPGDPESYWGVVGVFGGNPCMHPKFDELCAVMRKHVPFQQRGLWSNHLKGHGEACRLTFNPAHSNLNVHLDREAYDEMVTTWPEARQYVKGLDSSWPEATGLPPSMVGDSRHSPVYAAMRDLIPDEEERWRLIAKCDINQNWSAMIGLFRGELRGYFCEIAAAMAQLHQDEPDYPDLGVEVKRGWWRRPMSSPEFAAQARHFCHNCGAPMRGFGSLAIGGEREQVTETHAGIYNPKTKGRPVELVQLRAGLSEQSLERMTDYVQNGNL